MVSPGFAPDRRTALPVGTRPIIDTSMKMRSEEDESPPASEISKSRHALATPSRKDSNQLHSRSGGDAIEIRKCMATPPIAATSLTFAAMALYAMESGGWRLPRKWLFSATRSEQKTRE